MIPEQFIWIGVIVNLIGSFWYVKGILAGHTKPNLVSWILWLLGPFLGVFFQLKAGAGLSVLPVFLASFGPLIVVIFAIINRKAYWKINAFDIVCGAFSVFALVLYVLTHNLAISIVFAILSDFFAFIPTYIKGWKFPETEAGFSSFCYVIANVFGLMVIKDWSFVIYSFGLYLVLANIAQVFILYRKKILFWYNH